ncbi:arsenate-mycothiol transferase ArsC [Methylolobus aquaticus]
MQRRVLFLCTGNYFRSRFAELLFNHFAAARSLAWMAESRGLALDLSTDNIGPISPHTLRGLAQRGLPPPDPARFPLTLQEHDLLNAGMIIALKEAEHRPLLASRFPQWVDRVEYWHVHDVDCSLPEDALAEIERAIPVLLARLD